MRTILPEEIAIARDRALLLGQSGPALCRELAEYVGELQRQLDALKANRDELIERAENKADDYANQLENAESDLDDERRHHHRDQQAACGFAWDMGREHEERLDALRKIEASR